DDGGEGEDERRHDERPPFATGGGHGKDHAEGAHGAHGAGPKSPTNSIGTKVGRTFLGGIPIEEEDQDNGNEDSRVEVGDAHEKKGAEIAFQRRGGDVNRRDIDSPGQRGAGNEEQN